MLHVLFNEINKLSMLRALESGLYLMAFCSWGLYEFQLLHRTTIHSWFIKTATQLEKPRYVIFALQVDRKNHVREYESIQPLKIKQREDLIELRMLSVR